MENKIYESLTCSCLGCQRKVARDNFNLISVKLGDLYFSLETSEIVQVGLYYRLIIKKTHLGKACPKVHCVIAGLAFSHRPAGLIIPRTPNVVSRCHITVCCAGFSTLGPYQLLMSIIFPGSRALLLPCCTDIGFAKRENRLLSFGSHL